MRFFVILSLLRLTPACGRPQMRREAGFCPVHLQSASRLRTAPWARQSAPAPAPWKARHSPRCTASGHQNQCAQRSHPDSRQLAAAACRSTGGAPGWPPDPEANTNAVKHNPHCKLCTSCLSTFESGRCVALHLGSTHNTDLCLVKQTMQQQSTKHMKASDERSKRPRQPQQTCDNPCGVCWELAQIIEGDKRCRKTQHTLQDRIRRHRSILCKSRNHA